jgi:DNA-binding NtrC family response regulator
MNENLYPSFSILLVDDEPAWLDALSLSLERNTGMNNILLCQDSTRAMEMLANNNIGLVVLDLNMPNLTGQELLKLISEQYPQVVTIVLTGMNQLEVAIDCMKLGAFDYHVKTEGEGRLIKALHHAIRSIELETENRNISNRLLSGVLEHPEIFSEIITVNKVMGSIFQYIESVAGSSHPILITGESGVGKELIARAIHTASGRTGPMVCINVAGLDDNVFADTLFGHVKGAYTGADTVRNGLVEEAAMGTLFLDEMGDLSISSQLKLLRILNDGEYYPIGSDRPKRLRARVVVATNVNLQAKMAANQFRKDLFYRLQTHKIHIPPLNERKQDLPVLLDHFLEEASQDVGKKKPTPPKELLHLLETYAFPGNVRELRSMVFDAIAQHKSGILSMTPFLKAMGRFESDSSMQPEETEESTNMFSALATLPSPEQAVKLLLDEAMKRAKGNQSMAARLLGMSQPALCKRLKRAEKGTNSGDAIL